jgi:hypothetical protein
MNQDGAERWTGHMRGALKECSAMMDAIDPRITPVIKTFIRFYLERYAGMFGFDATVLDL